MKKLVNGIKEFRKDRRTELLPIFSGLALGQKPDALYIGCSDSRVAVNVFASTDPGDLLVVRNVGNIVAPCNHEGISDGDLSEWAAIEFAVQVLKVKDIIVCGHSECGAISAACNQEFPLVHHHLKNWVNKVETQTNLESQVSLDTNLSDLNKVSQLNVLNQIENLKSSTLIRNLVNKGELRLNAWWFDIKNLNVYSFDNVTKSFKLIE